MPESTQPVATCHLGIGACSICSPSLKSGLILRREKEDSAGPPLDVPREPVQDGLPAGALLLGGVRFFRVEGLPDSNAVALLDELHAQRTAAESAFDQLVADDLP